MLQILQGVEVRPRRVLLYGVHGIGKSTWAAAAPRPIFIQTEDGLGDIGCDRFPVAESYDQVLDQIGQVCSEKHAYQTVVLDSLDWLEKLIWAKVAATEKVASIEKIGYGKGYVFALSLWREVLGALNYLRVERKMGVVLIAHSAVKRVELPDQDGFDSYTPALHRTALATVAEWCDEILFANYRIFTKNSGDGLHEKTKALGDGERVVYTGERPSRVAKNRLNLPDELPLAWAEYARHFPQNGETKNG